MYSNEILVELRQKLKNVLKETCYQFSSDNFRENYIKSSMTILDKLKRKMI